MCRLRFRRRTLSAQAVQGIEMLDKIDTPGRRFAQVDRRLDYADARPLWLKDPCLAAGRRVENLDSDVVVTTTETYEPGRRFGPYELLEPLGHGGMGYVWKARDTRLDRVVAVKFSHQRFTERFTREAKAIAALNHPHICMLYDVGPDYLVMEFIDGQPLRGPLPLKNALEYGIQVVAALAEAHRKGIVHRDLKPANIMVAEEGVKVLDFGLAKQVEPQVGREHRS